VAPSGGPTLAWPSSCLRGRRRSISACKAFRYVLTGRRPLVFCHHQPFQVGKFNWIKVEEGSTVPVMKYSAHCLLCKLACVFAKPPRHLRALALFHWRLDVDEGDLGVLVAKCAKGIYAHQMCMDYAFHPDMTQKHELPFDDQLDGFGLEAISAQLKATLRRCCFCKKRNATSTCAFKSCNNKKICKEHICWGTLK